MQREESSFAGKRAADRAGRDAAKALWHSPELSESIGRSNETGQDAFAAVVRALSTCYLELISEVQAGLHGLYESTVSEIRLNCTGTAVAPDERGEKGSPGCEQALVADEGDPLGEYGGHVRPSALEISLN